MKANGHRAEIRSLILGSPSLDTVEYYYREGRISPRTFDIYRSLWRNGAARFSSVCIHFDRPHWQSLARAAFSSIMKGQKT